MKKIYILKESENGRSAIRFSFFFFFLEGSRMTFQYLKEAYLVWWEVSLPMAGGCNSIVFLVPYNPKHSMILLFYETILKMSGSKALSKQCITLVFSSLPKVLQLRASTQPQPSCRPAPVLVPPSAVLPVASCPLPTAAQLSPSSHRFKFFWIETSLF